MGGNHLLTIYFVYLLSLIIHNNLNFTDMRTIRLKKLLFTLAALFAATMTASAQEIALEGDLYNKNGDMGRGARVCHYYLRSDRTLVLEAVSTDDKTYSGKFTEWDLYVYTGTSNNDGFKNLQSNRNAVEKIIVSKGIKTLGHQVIGYSNNAGILFPNLKSVEINPEDFEGEIPSDFLKNYTTLESVTFYQENVTINSSAFSGCTALNSVSLPNITNLEIHGQAFKDCTSLKTFYTNGCNVKVGGGAFEGSGLETFQNSSSTPYVTKITLGTDAFNGATNLKTFAIYDSATACDIPLRAFQDCTALESFIAMNTGEIDNGAFSGCTALKSFYALQGISKIGNGAFSGCSSLETFSLPSNNSLSASPDYNAFNNCDNLKYIDLRNASFTQCGDIGVPDHTMLYLPSNCSIWRTYNVIVDGQCKDCRFYEGKATGFADKFTAEKVTYDRTLDAERLYTVCLPYVKKQDGWKYYTMKKVEGTTVEFEEVAQDDLKADEPYIVYTGAKGGNLGNAASTQVGGLESRKQWDKYSLQGNFGKTIDADYLAINYTKSDLYILQSDKKWKIYDGTQEGVNIPPFRAFIYTDKGTGAKALLASDFGDGTTAIENIRTIGKDGSEQWFDLQGRRIDAPRKGINIVNGKKVIIK